MAAPSSPRRLETTKTDDMGMSTRAQTVAI